MIITTKIETDLGEMIAGATDEGICLLEFSDRRMLNTEYKDLERYFKTTIEEGENRHLITLRKQLKEYFEGYTKEFSVPLVTPGTDISAGCMERTYEYSIWYNPFLPRASCCSWKA